VIFDRLQAPLAAREIKIALGDKKPKVIFLPNYSKSSGVIMAGLKEQFPKAIFLGGDGWGTNSFGFIQNGPNLTGVTGYTARGSIPSEQALKSFKIGRALLNNPSAAKQFPESNTALAILKIVEGTTDILCKSKPKTKKEFTKAFRAQAKLYLKPTWGVGVYKLENSDISFFKGENL
jgi:hypothetical protein